MPHIYLNREIYNFSIKTIFTTCYHRLRSAQIYEILVSSIKGIYEFLAKHFALFNISCLQLNDAIINKQTHAF